MSCVLRAWGKKFDVERFARTTKIQGYSLYLKGAPRFPKSKPNGPKNKFSGFHIVASEADFDRLDVQIKDAVRFLRKNKSELKRLSRFPGVEQITLDFGIEKRNVMAQFDYFPPELLLSAGQIGIGMELSQYDGEPKGKSKPQDIVTLKKQYQ